MEGILKVQIPQVACNLPDLSLCTSYRLSQLGYITIPGAQPSVSNKARKKAFHPADKTRLRCICYVCMFVCIYLFSCSQAGSPSRNESWRYANGSHGGWGVGEVKGQAH